VNYVFSASAGTVAPLTAQNVQKSVYKISERLIQNFQSGDQRFVYNFSNVAPYVNQNFGTRWRLLRADQVTIPSGINFYASYNTTAGGPMQELFIASSWEENQLMLAEANIRLGNVNKGLGYIDAVRSYQGAGVAPLASAAPALSQTQAMQALVAERQVALLFRGVAFYDARRWGWIYDKSNGGGSYGNTFLVDNSNVDTNTFINYNFLDFWDVPADESVLNPSTSSVATVNPNF
jgi:hypothetical protein